MWAAPAAAQRPIEGDIAIGPVRFGMTADEVMAAAPELAWVIERYDDSDKVRAVRAQGFVFAGQTFDVVVLPGLDGGDSLGLWSRSMIDMDACEDGVVALVAAMEPIFGPFSPSYSFRIPVGDGVIAAGAESTLTADRDRVNALWDTQRLAPNRDDRHHAMVHGHFNGRGEAAGCFITADVTRQAPVDTVLEVPFDAVRFLETPPIGVLHHSLDGVDLSGGDVEVTMRCEVSRDYGLVYACAPAGAAAEPGRALTPAEAAADMRARAMRADPASFEPDTIPIVMVEIPVRLSAADRRAPGPPENLRYERHTRWREAPERYEIEDEIMWVHGSPPATFDLTLSCQIQEDLSLICTEHATSTGEPLPAGVDPFALAHRYRSAETFRDGPPAAGAWVAITYRAPKP
jgi:hypothetical protein